MIAIKRPNVNNHKINLTKDIFVFTVFTRPLRDEVV